MAEPAQPRIILQTKSYRIIAKACPPFEGRQRPDEIIVEERRQTGMDEQYWGPVHYLFDTKMSMTKDEKFIMGLFQEVAKQANETKELGARVKKMAEEQNPITIEVPLRPAKPTISRSERRAMLAELLISVGNALRGDVTVTPGSSMPFDNRDGAMALEISPAILDKLHELFPGLPSAAQLVSALLGHSAAELR